MPTEKQLIKRQEHRRLGSSDMPVILGLSYYKTAYDLWLEFTEKLLPENGASKPAYAGHRFEEGVLEFAEEQLGKIIRNQFRTSKTLPLQTHIDGILKATQEPVEAKTANLFFYTKDRWGESGTDEIPHSVRVQAQVHMLCLNNDIQVCHIPAFIGGRGFQLYHINRLAWLDNVIAEQAVKFMEAVSRDIPPEDRGVTLETVKRLRKIPSKTVYFSFDGLTQEYYDIDNRLKVLKKEHENVKAKFLATLSNAEKVVITGCEKDFIVQSQDYRYFNKKKLQEDDSELYNKYVEMRKKQVPKWVKKED